MRHVLAVATKNHFASQSGQWSPRRLLASIVVWLVAMHAQKRNFWTNRFGWARWARHINDYENAHCTRTLSSPCYMRFIWHNGRRHSFLIYELLWDTPDELWCTRHWRLRRQNSWILVIKINHNFFTYFTVHSLRIGCKFTLGNFDTVWHALVESILMRRANSQYVCMYVY